MLAPNFIAPSGPHNRRIRLRRFAGRLDFVSLALGMAPTPGPDMIYLVSRSLRQGRAAGLTSLGGAGTGAKAEQGARRWLRC